LTSRATPQRRAAITPFIRTPAAATAIIRRGWLLAAVAVIYYAGETFFNGTPTPTSRTAGVALAAVAFYAVYMLFCGVNGNRWLSDSLRRRGVTLIGEERR